MSVDSILVLANNEDLLGSTGGIVNYKTYPMIRYRRRIMFSVEDLMGIIYLIALFVIIVFYIFLMNFTSFGGWYGWAVYRILRTWGC